MRKIFLKEEICFEKRRKFLLIVSGFFKEEFQLCPALQPALSRQSPNGDGRASRTGSSMRWPGKFARQSE